jgi:long-subunit acyl-CoA synthetase (AMP-forming)
VPGSVGILWPSMEARIVKDDGTEADYNETGELHVRGGSIALGYWRNEKATRDTFLSEGWLRTGDQFRADEHGNLL